MTPQRLAADLGLDPADPIVLTTCAVLAENISKAAACKKLAGKTLNEVRDMVRNGTATYTEAEAYFQVWVIGKSSYRLHDGHPQTLSARQGPNGEDVWVWCSIFG